MDTRDWYYADGENSVGPSTEEHLLGLHADGVINDDTPLCPAGGEEWLPFSEALPKSNGLAQGSPEPIHEPPDINSERQQTPPQDSRSRKALSALIIILLVVLTGAAIFMVGGKSHPSIGGSNPKPEVGQPTDAPMTTPVADASQTPESDQHREWNRLLGLIDEYQSLVPPQRIEILKKIDEHSYEARLSDDIGSAGNSFILITTKPDFTSTGTAFVPMAFVKDTVATLDNGFQKETKVFEEVDQDDYEEVAMAKAKECSTFEDYLRYHPPDAATLNGYVQALNERNGRHPLSVDVANLLSAFQTWLLDTPDGANTVHVLPKAE